ncbi:MULTISPECIES: DUF4112 domain-containing protein [unclassified Sphingomonas]|jgi:hypothetical protein|uniref:DUF4112 domain-containing protein n=1 Tax=Sphingomonas sp. PvP015 TaxID=3156388 RepID=UPI00339A427C
MTNTASRFDPAQLAATLPLGRDPAAVRQRVEALERILERAFILPGLNRPVGLDFIVGLIPVVGDLIAAAMGSWLVWEARNLGLSKFQIARMMGNVGFDAVLGFVPFVGDAADLYFRSNTRNLKIIKRHLDKHHPSTVTLSG